MNQVLYIVPYMLVPHSGAEVRDYNIVKKLIQKKIDIIILCNYLENQNDYISNTDYEYPFFYCKINRLNIFKRIKIALVDQLIPSVENYNNTESIDKIIHLIKKFEINVVNSNTIFEAKPTLNALKKADFKGKSILTLHNVDYLNFYNQINLHKNPIERVIRNRAFISIKKDELDMIYKYDKIIVVSNVDKNKYIENGIPEYKINIVPNGVDIKWFDHKINFKNVNLKHPNLLFMGKLSYKPNIEALEKYIFKIHPKVKKSIPQIKFYIIGKYCPEWVKDISLKDETINIIGYVEDVRPYLSEADICIAPIWHGSGTRLKILEYLSMKKPVVSTSIGAEGLEIINGKHLLLADNEVNFCNDIIKLLTNKKLASHLAENGQKIVREKYDWEKVVNQLIEIYRELGEEL